MLNHRPVISDKTGFFVPSPIEISWHLPKILGCGGGLKSTFCLGRGTSSFLSQNVGDLTNLESYNSYIESIEHLKRVFQFEPEVAACDLHPDYISSHYAEELGLPLYHIQHHHAHAVAVMAEHNLDGPVLAVIMDGAGYGPDGTVWGGEILQADLTSYTRLGHLSHLHLPGGDAAAAEPWRMALSALYGVSGEKALHTARLPPSLQHLDGSSVEVIRTMLDKNFNAPLTSSCGRLFDAIAALLGVCQYNSYEGQAAIELESLAKKAVTTSWLDRIPPIHCENNHSCLLEKNGNWEISSLKFIKMACDDLTSSNPLSLIALNFHVSLINSITELIQKLSHETGIDLIVLSGGCMQNSLLLEGLTHTLSRKKLQVYTGNFLPVNDGAISFGQAVAGGLQHLA